MDEHQSAAVAAPANWTALVAVAAVLSMPAHAADLEQLASSVSITATHMAAQVCDEGTPVHLWTAGAVIVCVKQEPPAADGRDTVTVDRASPDEQRRPTAPEVMVIY